MTDFYSPHTGEHINTDDPADWMARAGTPAPAYDPTTASAFWRGTAWEVVPHTTSMPAPVVPQEVPRWAGKLALKRHKLQAGELIALAPDDEGGDDTLLAHTLAARGQLPAGEERDRFDAVFDDAKDWHRDSPTLAQLGAVLGLAPEHVDALFVWAASQAGA